MKPTVVRNLQTERENSLNKTPILSIDKEMLFDLSRAKVLRLIALSLVMVAALSISSCNSPSEKVKNAKAEVTEANQDLDKAQQAYRVDIENYRTESKDRIEANNKSIVSLKTRIKNEKSEATIEFNKQIAQLEQKNTELKKRIIDYKADSKDGWYLFKSEFKKDMDELELAMKNFFNNDK